MSILNQYNVEDSTDSGKVTILKVTWAGLLVNLVLAGAKLALGIIGASQALVADAFHSLADLVTDFAIIFGVRFWIAPADDDHPYGHRKIETIVTAFIGLALVIIAVGIGWNAVSTLRDPYIKSPSSITLIAAVLSIVLKEFLYRWTVSHGKRIRSSAVVANAWHHRSDAISSMPVALVILVTIAWPRLAFLDHLGAFAVSLFILHAAWRIIKPTLDQLCDKAAPAEVAHRIEQIAMAHPQIRETHKIRTRKGAEGIRADMHILVDGAMSVREGHAVSSELKRELLEADLDIVDTIVHLEPFEDGGKKSLSRRGSAPFR